jgi:ABC-type multidrug transport system permease subunit
MLDILTTVHNERTKLTATYLNGVAIAVIAVGGLAPIFSAFYNGQFVSLLLPVGAFVCFVLSYTLHFGAKWVLRGLRS